MTFAEMSAINGTGAQFGINRFGDYSQTSLDPDGVTFWHTGEYISGNAIRTRIFSWQINSTTTGITSMSSAAELLVTQDDEMLNVKAGTLPGDIETQVDLFDVSGKLIASKKIKPSNNSLQTSFGVAGLSKQTYLVRIGNYKFQKVVKVILH
jgi:hypothetical protein